MKPAPDAGDDPLSRLDHMVGSAPEPENAVLTDNARLVRWTGPAFAAFSLILLPWIGYIAVSLPTFGSTSCCSPGWRPRPTSRCAGRGT